MGIESVDFLGEGTFTKRDDFVRGVAEDLKKSDRSLLYEISEHVGDLKWDMSDKGELRNKRTGSEILQSGFVTGCTDVGLSFVVLARALDIPTKYVETFYKPWLDFTASEKNIQNANNFRRVNSDYLREVDRFLSDRGADVKKITKNVYDKWLDFCDDSSVPTEQLGNLLKYNGQCVEGHVFVDVFSNDKWSAYEPVRGFTKKGGYSMNIREYVEVGKGLDFSEVYIKERGVYRKDSANLQNLDEAIRIFKPSHFKKK